MELSICRDEFLRGVNTVHNVAVLRGTMPILSHLLVQALDNRIYLYGTDLELGIKGEAEAQVFQEGSICLSARMLADILRELPEGEQVHVSLEENNLVRIACGKTCCHLAGLPAEEFPPFPVYEMEKLVSIPRETLRDMIVKINITVPLVEQKHLSAPNGALLEIDRESMEMMGTDGHRLSYIKKPGISEFSRKIKVILPKKSMNELKRILDDSQGSDDSVLVGFFENQTVFKIGPVELFSRLLETYFPNIRPRIAKVNDKVIQINRQELRQSVKRVSIFTEEKEKYIRLRLEDGTLFLSSQNLGVGDAEDQLSVNYNGEPLEIGFNSNFILDILNILNEEQVVLEMSDHNSHGIIRQVDNRDYLYLIMPIKLFEDEF
ncbi:MAG: DNA polymerase III subunit beta [bacterium]